MIIHFKQFREIWNLECSMFDYSLTNRPCFLYQLDITTYDRGWCFDLDELPFPSSKTIDELVRSIHNFDYENYCVKLTEFRDDKIGMYCNGMHQQK